MTRSLHPQGASDSDSLAAGGQPGPGPDRTRTFARASAPGWPQRLSGRDPGAAVIHLLLNTDTYGRPRRTPAGSCEAGSELLEIRNGARIRTRVYDRAMTSGAAARPGQCAGRPTVGWCRLVPDRWKSDQCRIGNEHHCDSMRKMTFICTTRGKKHRQCYASAIIFNTCSYILTIHIGPTDFWY